MAQGRIALANTAGRGTENVNNAPNLPADVAALRLQLDDAVQAVMASLAEGRIKGKVTLSNGKSRRVTAKLSPPLPDWLVPLQYAISPSGNPPA